MTGVLTRANAIDQFEELRPVFLRVIEYARARDLDMIQGDHEDAPGQLELNFMFEDALRTCDRLTTYRQSCAQGAHEFNLIACFMSKPFMGMSAPGRFEYRAEGKLVERGPGVHVLTGPVYVCGTEPGDLLEVRVVDLKVAHRLGRVGASGGSATQRPVGLRWHRRSPSRPPAPLLAGRR